MLINVVASVFFFLHFALALLCTCTPSLKVTDVTKLTMSTDTNGIRDPRASLDMWKNEAGKYLVYTHHEN